MPGSPQRDLLPLVAWPRQSDTVPRVQFPISAHLARLMSEAAERTAADAVRDLAVDALVPMAWILAAWLLSKATGRWISWRTRRLLSREAYHRAGVVSASGWAFRSAVWVAAAAQTVAFLDIPVGSLVPAATVVGFALGWGLQRLVLDILAGFFLLAERQFSVGDLIRISPPGQHDGIEGRVEELTLRVVKLRTFDGDLVTLANSELRQVANLSRDWARVVVDVPTDLDGDWDGVAETVEDICARLATDPAYGPDLLEAPTVVGVESLTSDVATLRVTGRTLPGRQRRVARELRRRIAAALAVDPHVQTSPSTGPVPVIRDDTPHLDQRSHGTGEGTRR